MKLKDLPDSIDIGKIHTMPAEEPRPVDRELPRAMDLQHRWLELPLVKSRRKSLGWDAAIHQTSRVTYRDVKDTPHYGWHSWMKEQLGREETE